ncbi:hypothetical protein SAMN02799622_03974 [Methylobacterium sp. UNC378MF]|uniref:hypothetical protein n=1 Tax=Methylobacterium sp. UNC378MF TaxID=1502748 RepID=UPI00088A598B|nr:hypothetical protein [Methylobacterium sp. UNC378MF]SDA27098.1 hypothetical protein SAMN02799622_03974 [Methylobacterium sp. UNC378MF]
MARALKLDREDKAHKSKITGMLKVWIEKGRFEAVDGKDAKGKPRKFVEFGGHASDTGE